MPVSTDQLLNLIGQATSFPFNIPAIDIPSTPTLGAANSVLNKLTIQVSANAVTVAPNPAVIILPDFVQSASRICNITSSQLISSIPNNTLSVPRIDLIVASVDDTISPPSATFSWVQGNPGPPPLPNNTTQVAVLYVNANSNFNAANVTVTVTLPIGVPPNAVPYAGAFIESFLTPSDQWWLPNFDWGPVVNHALPAVAPGTLLFQAGKSYSITTPIGFLVSGLSKVVIAGCAR